MKKVDLKRVVEKEWVGHLMRCDYCGLSYVIQEGDRIEMRRYEKICHDTWAIGPVLECECGESTIQKNDLEKWDGYEAKEDSEELKYMNLNIFLTRFLEKLQNFGVAYTITPEASLFGDMKHRVEFIVSQDNMMQIYEALGGKL